MPVRLVPPSRNAAAEYLMKLYAETEQKIIREIARKRVQGYVDYAETAALTRVRRTLQEMVDKSGKYVPLAVEKEFYRDSAKHAAGYANARGMIQNPASTLAIEQLSDNLLGQVQEMAVTSYQSAAFLLGRPEADVFRELGIRNAAQVMALGKGALTATEAFVAQIEAHGITAFVDKAGRKWSLRAYGNMAVRTTVRQAQVSAVLTRDDHDLYKIVRHRAPCEVCAVYADRIYSKSGTNPNYPPLAQAFGKIDPTGPNELSNTFLNIHPSCLCSLIPWTELGKTDAEIQKARDRSSFEKNPADKEYRGKKEIEEYRQKERNRAFLMEQLREWRGMLAAGIEGVPATFDTFRKHYGDNLYEAWLADYKLIKPKKTPVTKAPVIAYNSHTLTGQYKLADPLNEFEYWSAQKTNERINDIVHLSGFNYKKAEKVLYAFSGDSAEYQSIGSGTPRGWFYHADNDIRNLSGGWKEAAKEIDDYITAAPKFKGQIYRGMALDDETIDNIKPGNIFSETGSLSSWTSDSDVARMFAEGRSEELSKKPVIIESSNPAYGTPVSHLSLFGDDESEVIVSNMHGADYLIESKEIREGKIYVKLKELQRNAVRVTV